MAKTSLAYFSCNKSQRQPRRALFTLCLLTSVVFYLSAATNMAIATTYYLDAVDGNDRGLGTSGNPWKTLARAIPTYSGAGAKVQLGDTVYLRSGNYGDAVFNYVPTPVPTSWSDKIAYIAESGANPEFSYLGVTGAYDRYFEFDGIRIVNTSLPAASMLVYFYNSRHLKLLNCYIQGSGTEDRGVDDWSYQGIYVKHNSGTMTDILIDNCEVTCCQFGITADGYSGDTDFIIRNNTIHFCGSSGIAISGYVRSEPIIIEGNHIYYQFQPPGGGLHGSGISLRVYPVTVRKNIIRYYGNTHPITQYWEVFDGGIVFTGVLADANSFSKYETVHQVDTGATGEVYKCTTSSGITTLVIKRYQEDNAFVSGKKIEADDGSGILKDVNVTEVRTYGGYKNMTYENNLIYDSRNVTPVHFADIGSNFRFCNNTVIGRWNKKVSDPTAYRNRYYDAVVFSPAIGNNCSSLFVYNNILIGETGFACTDAQFANIQENYNLIWSAYTTGYVKKSSITGPNTKIFVDAGGHLIDGISPDYFELSGNFFVGGGNFNTYGYQYPPDDLNPYGNPHGVNLNDAYELAASSLAIGFANPVYAPATDILGNLRDALPDAGCYEYGVADPNSQSYSLSITAAHGTAAKTPNKTSYSSGEVVSLQATPNTGYHFVSWSGDITDTNNPATITMNSNKSVTANFAINTYTLTITATNGSVSKTPSKSSYNHGESVSLTATANTGYHFVNWSGDASGTNSTTSVVMNSNKSITANFSPNTYTLTVNSSNGSVTKTPNKTTYNYGEQVTLQAVPNTGYHFSNWSGSASGTSSIIMITMNANKTVTANCAINTYTLDISAVFGSVTKSPDKALYNYGETVSLQAVPNSGYAFTGWADDASGSSNPVNLTMNANKSVTANFIYTLVDNNAPSIDKSTESRWYPRAEPTIYATQVPLDCLFIIPIVDEGQGIDANTVSIKVNNNLVYTADTADYNSTYGRCHRIGNIAEYTYIYQPYQSFDFEQTVTVDVSAADLAGNQMNDSYSFKTEMLSFGKNQKVNSDADSLSNGRPATVKDSSGNIWAVWHKGAAGSRDIYIGKLTADATTFESSIQLTTEEFDQCNPAIAADSTDKLYVVWQDDRRGNWDIYLSTFDGIDWSSATRITDSNANQVNPAIAIDHSSPNKVYVAWQDDQNVNQDIYVATSTNSFSTKTITRITSVNSDQAGPAIAIAATNTAYIIWTDLRNGSKDIYGAASNSGPWTNVALVTGTGDQSEPAVAAEATGSILHLLWVDNSSGNNDIYYASCSGGLHALSGASIIDDSSGADQNEPSIIVKGSTGSSLKVFACWRDQRNTDSDLYFVQIGAGSGTNIFIGDNGTDAAQSDPVIGIDAGGYPYLLWADNRSTNTDIFYAGSTHTQTNLLLSQNASMESETIIGKIISAITGPDDISILIPAETFLSDVNITGSRVENPPNLSINFLSAAYEFGPSGITFDQPVTIIIPYIASGSGSATVYWYDALYDAASQQGITNVEDIVIGDVIGGTLHAIRFKTNHFTWYFIGEGGSDGSGGGGGGGCSLAAPGKGSSIIEFVLPFLALAIVMAIVKWQDRRNQKRSTSNIDRV